MQKLGAISSVLFLLLVVFVTPLMAKSQSVKVGAVFLFKFFDYTTWPARQDPKKTGNGVVCTLGDHPFGDALTYIASKKSGDVRYQVRKLSNLDEADNCHIIYLSKRHFDTMGSIKGANILVTIGHDGFLQQGGVIEMMNRDNRMRLRIHLKNAKDRDLKFSSRLLKIAEIVQ
jgi:hypothetical protein